MFQHQKTDYKGELKERRVNHKRHYETTTGKLYPSVTTVTGILSKDKIAEWREKEGEKKADYITFTAAAIGTEFHNIVENYLCNTSLEDLELKYKNIIPMAHFWNARDTLLNINNIHGLEAGIYTDQYKLAGRVDCIAEYKGVLSIIDFKTSKYKKPEDWILGYYCQATAYREAWKERTGEDIKQLVIIMSGLDGSVTTYIKNPDEYIEDLKETIIKYEEDVKNNGRQT